MTLCVCIPLVPMCVRVCLLCCTGFEFSPPPHLPTFLPTLAERPGGALLSRLSLMDGWLLIITLRAPARPARLFSHIRLTPSVGRGTAREGGRGGMRRGAYGKWRPRCCHTRGRPAGEGETRGGAPGPLAGLLAGPLALAARHLPPPPPNLIDQRGWGGGGRATSARSPLAVTLEKSYSRLPLVQ